MHLARPILVLSFAGSAFSALAAGPSSSLVTNDALLIKHIRETDEVFSRVLSTCEREQLHRSESGVGGKFTYTGTCLIRSDDRGDCPSYKVVASGTVDTEQWATVRSVFLELQCFG